ncbi:MAG: class I SAM-dependent methyltransferase [Promethearchaeota archaeon]
MGNKISLISTVLRHPRRVAKMLNLVKGTRLYITAVIGEVLDPFLSSLDTAEKAQSITTLIERHGIANPSLFKDMLSLLQEEGYLKRSEDDKIWLATPLSQDMFEAIKPKIASEVLDAFEPFYKQGKQASKERLAGIPPSDFDADELRVLWTVALKGDFYRMQRDQAFKFAQIAKFLKQRSSPLHVLDFGCGSGDGTVQLYKFLEKKRVNAEIEACDPAEGLLEVARDDAMEFPLYFFNSTRTSPKTAYYDAIFSCQVFHWEPNPTKLIGVLKTYLKPNGILFGVQSYNSPRLRPIDLFIRIMGAQGFPPLGELHKWFSKNDLKLDYHTQFYAFKAQP